MEEKLMTMSQAKEDIHSYAHDYHDSPRKMPNKFAKDGIKCHDTDYFSFWKSVNAQVAHQIEEKKRVAREEESKKRASKKKKGDVVDG